MMNQTTHSVTLTVPLSLNFTNDLPNGPYCTGNPLGYKCYISQTGCAMDLKNLVERFSSNQTGTANATMVSVNFKTQSSVLSLNYKGQMIPWDYSLTMMNNGDEVTATLGQTMTAASKVKIGCCKLI